MQNFNQHLTILAHGVIKGSATAAQMPAIACRAVILRAHSANTGSVYIGLSEAVTASHTATNVTTGFEMPALVTPDHSPALELPIKGLLSTLWYICDGADDDLTYLALG